MDLVVHHVLQTLVVGRAQEDLSVHLSAGVTVVHHLKRSCLFDTELMRGDGIVQRERLRFTPTRTGFDSWRS